MLDETLLLDTEDMRLPLTQSANEKIHACTRLYVGDARNLS
jgi:hypothetical protein